MRRPGTQWGLTPRRVPARLGVPVLAAVAALAGPMLPALAGTAPAPLPDMASIAQVIGAPALWQAGGTGNGIGVALVDTGVTPVGGLDAPGKLTYGPDLSFDAPNPSLAYQDGYGHGTAMAGIIAGNDGTAGGYRGIAPDAHLVSVKVGASNGATDVSQIIAGIDWVVQHAHDPGLNIRVLNLSLGTGSTQNYQLDPLAHAAEAAWRHGIVVVASVGNDGTSSTTVADPAIDPYLLAVGAEDPQGTVSSSDDTIASFSARGTGIRHADVVAPGTYIMGLLSPNSALANQYPNAVFGGRFLRGSGTSQAAAIASGAAADLLSLRPDLTPDQVKALLMAGAVKVGTPNPNFIGSGLIQLGGLGQAPAPSGTQSYGYATGSGSLDRARGSSRVTLDGTPLSGEQDIFGQAWPASSIADAEEGAGPWSGGQFNGTTWSGGTWSGTTWSGGTWSGTTWSGTTWSGGTWSGTTWSGTTWSGGTWSGTTWSGTTWSGTTWSGTTWSGTTWSGTTWSGTTWSGGSWG